jgi:AraC family transcriptional regulator of adaptative response/methylated-DNA-[protein]-cysteine methyltransferase
MNKLAGRAPTDAEWLALQERAAGRVIFGVISTGIFCRCGCPARTPLRKNLRMFDQREEAVAAGLRACLRCKP